MNEGKIEQIGRPVEIYESPVSSFTAAFIGDTNFFDGQVIDILPDNYSRLAFDGLPDAMCFNDAAREAGDMVYVSVRPEKITMHRVEPDNSFQKNFDFKMNIINGFIENLVYLGSYTKYWVKAGGWMISAQQQHHHFQLDEKPLTWNDEVWLSWHADDGFMLQRYDLDDEQMLTMPEDGDLLAKDLGGLEQIDDELENENI